MPLNGLALDSLGKERGGDFGLEGALELLRFEVFG